MAIPASHIVNVLPRVIDGGSADLELNGLLLVENDIISASTLVLSFPSASAVGAYFGTDSVEYSAAEVYFTSYNNKPTAPKAFLISRRIADDAAAWLRGARYVGTLTQLKSIEDGGLTISIDSTAVSVTGINLSGVSSFSDVALAIQTKISAAAPGSTVLYSSLTGAFTITSGTKGEDSEVGYASAPSTGTDLSELLNLTELSGAVKSSGMNSMSESEQMAVILSKTQNWVSFTTAWEADIDEALAWAAWANANYGYLYVPYSTSPNMASPDSTTDMASVIKSALYDHTAVVYGSLEYAVFIMGGGCFCRLAAC